MMDGVNWLTLCNFKRLSEVLLISKKKLVKLTILGGNFLFPEIILDWMCGG